jgi:hypothetical protein
MFYRDKLSFSLDELGENEAYLTIGKGAPVLALLTMTLPISRRMTCNLDAVPLIE